MSSDAGSSSSSASGQPGFEKLPRPKNTRRSAGRRTDHDEEYNVFRFGMRNVFRSYTNTMKVIDDIIRRCTDKSFLGPNGKSTPFTCPSGNFRIRVLKPSKRCRRPQEEEKPEGAPESSSKKIITKKQKRRHWMKTNNKKKKISSDNFVDLVIRHSDLYLLGFVHRGTYYRLTPEKNEEDDKEKGQKRVEESEVEAEEVVDVPFSGSYKGLGIFFEDDIGVGVRALLQMYNALTNYNDLKSSLRLDLVQKALATAVIVFCESLRFPKLQKFVAYGLGRWYAKTGVNILIPKGEATLHFHNWSTYSSMVLGHKVFTPSRVFQTLDDLIEFLGVLLRTA